MAKRTTFTRSQVIALVKKYGYNGRRMERKLRWTRGKLTHHLMLHRVFLQPALRYHTDEELIEAIAMCDSIEELCAHLKVNRGQLKDNLRARGLQTGYAKNKRKMGNIPTSVLKEMYRQASYNIQRLARRLGFSHHTVRKHLWERGIETRAGRTLYSWDHYELHQLHVVQGFNTWDIAELYGATERGVRHAMETFGVPIVNNKRDGRPKPTERPRRPMTDEAWDATPGEASEEHDTRRGDRAGGEGWVCRTRRHP